MSLFNSSNTRQNSFLHNITDSGATEYLTNTRVIFNSFNEVDYGKIRCANKDASADIKTGGVGILKVVLGNNKSVEIESVVYTNDLSDNLLSLKKFAEMGFTIYLDNKEINIFDPVSNESFITGV